MRSANAGAGATAMVLPRWRWWEMLLAMLSFAIIGAIQAPGIMHGGLGNGEAIGEYIPWRMEAMRLWAEGGLPFFTDRIFGGMPLLSTSYAGALYPPNFVYMLAGPWLWNWLSLLHTVVGGVGMMLYLRRWRLLQGPAYVGALLFVCCTFFFLHLEHIAMREAALLAPWVAWAARRVLAGPSATRAAVLAAAIAVQISCGYQQVFLFTVMWLGVDWLIAIGTSARVATRTAWMAIAGILGVGMMMIQILPGLEHVKETPRPFMEITEWQEASFPPSMVGIFLSSRAYGMGWADYVGDSWAGEVLTTLPSAGWVLATAAMLLALGSNRFGRNRGVAILVYTVASFVVLLLAFGEHFRMNPALFHVPPFSMFRVPSRWLLLACVFGSIVAAMGVQGLWRLEWRRRMMYGAAAWVLFALLTVGGAYLMRNVPPTSKVAGLDPLKQIFFNGTAGVAVLLSLISTILAVTAGRGARHRPLLLAVVLLALATDAAMQVRQASFGSLTLEQLRITRGTNPLLSSLPPGEEIVRLYAMSPDGTNFPADYLPGNTAAMAGLRTLNGYSPLVSRLVAWRYEVSQMGFGFRDQEIAGHPGVYRHVAVSHVLVEHDRMSDRMAEAIREAMGREYSVVVWGERSALLRLEGTRPRFDLAPMWIPVYDPEQTELHYIRNNDPAKAGGDTAALERPRWRELPPSGAPIPAGTVEVEVDHGSYQRVRVQSPAGAVLLIRDIYWPGWEYRHGPGDAEGWRSVRRANGIVRYAPAPAGDSLVELRYRPPNWRTATSISLLSLTAWLLLPIIAAVSPLVRTRTHSAAGRGRQPSAIQE